MATNRPPDEPIVVQLATRVPASLLHRIKVWCVEHDEMVMQFVEQALREELRRVRDRPSDQ